MNLLLSLAFVLSFVPTSHAIQCILNHEFTIDKFKDISMVKSTCYAATHCVHVHYEDKNRNKKQGYSVGCDKTDCLNISEEKGWKTDENGQICKKHRDYGTSGEICCCKSDFCNGIGSSMMGLSVLATLLLWVVA